VKKIDHNLEGLWTTDQHAGKLRLSLFFLVIFILWSSLALISSIAEPIAGNLFQLLNIAEPGNLAGSLVRDILANYFSLFSLPFLFMGLVFFWCGYRITLKLIGLAMQFPDQNVIGKHLKNCAFSNSHYPTYSLSDPDIYQSDRYKLLTRLGGPAFITVPSNSIALAIDQTGVRTIMPAESQPETFFLDHSAKLAGIVDTSPLRISQKVKALCNDGNTIQLGKIEVDCELAFDIYAASSGNQEKSLQTVEAIIQVSGDSPWKDVIKDIFKHEIKSLLLNSSSAELEQEFALNESQIQEPEPKASGQTHNLDKHKASYWAPVGPRHPAQSSSFMRNRKRAFQPEIRKQILDKQDTVEEINLLDTFSTSLSRLVNSYFKMNVFKITINKIGDITINGKF
jgi:hypothetical protein